MNGAIILALSNMSNNYSYTYDYKKNSNTSKKSEPTEDKLFEQATPEEIQANKDKMAEFDKKIKENQDRLLK